MAHTQTNYGGLWKPQNLAVDKVSSQKMFIDNINTIEEFILSTENKIHESVQTLTELRAIDTSDATLFINGMMIIVSNERCVYYFNRNSTTTDNGSTVIAPTNGVGRWIAVIPSHVPTHSVVATW